MMKAFRGRAFTGQRYIDDGIARQHPRESVACHKCGKPIGIRTTVPEDAGPAWLDPFLGNGKGKCVCRGCLSARRKAEVGAAEAASEGKGARK